MSKFIIEGKKPLKGEITLGGAKNAGFKMIIASLLSDDKSEIKGFSKISDIEITREIIRSLGGETKECTDHCLVVDAKNTNTPIIPENFGQKARASLIFAGVLLSRFGKAMIPLPGGDKIGSRPVDRHLNGLRAMGVKVEYQDNNLLLTAKRLKGTTYTFEKNSHTGTENLIIAAVLADGKTTLENAAAEPEIDNLIELLNSMGANIKRVRERTIEIEGVKKLHGTTFEIMPDRNEAVTFACAALITRGDILVKRAKKEHLAAFIKALNEARGGIEETKEGIRFFYKEPIQSTTVTSMPHPGFMTDWQALWAVLMTQGRGNSIIHETIYENRFAYVSSLVKMGAKIELFNPKVENPEKFYNFDWEDNKPEYFHAAKITGPTLLSGRELSACDIRAGATMTLAALCAEGKTVLNDIEHIERGYENLDGKLRSLGAKIEKKP